MKKINLLLCWLILSAGISQAQFEGRITLELKSESVQTMNLTIKNKQVMVAPQGLEMGEQAVIYMDGEKQKMTIFTKKGGEAVAMVMDLGASGPLASLMEMQKMQQRMQKGQTGPNEVHIEKTEKRKVIEGYNCVQYIGKSKDGTFEAWVTQELDLRMEDLFPVSGPMTDNIRSQMGIPDEMDGFVMQLTSKSIGSDAMGASKSMTYAAHIMPGSVSEEELSYTTKGTKVIDLGEMMQLVMSGQMDSKQMQDVMQQFEFMKKN